VSGSVEPRSGAGEGAGRSAVGRALAGFGLRTDCLAAAGLRAVGFEARFTPGFGFALVAVAAAVLEPPRAPGDGDVRFSLRCPGRDLGRLPSTPGSSLLSAATREK
jgi:hypothetical protein